MQVNARFLITRMRHGRGAAVERGADPHGVEAHRVDADGATHHHRDRPQAEVRQEALFRVPLESPEEAQVEQAHGQADGQAARDRAGLAGQDVGDLPAHAAGQRRAVATHRVAARQGDVPVDRGRLRFGLTGVDAGEAGVEHREVRFEQSEPGDGHRGHCFRLPRSGFREADLRGSVVDRPVGGAVRRSHFGSPRRAGGLGVADEQRLPDARPPGREAGGPGRAPFDVAMLVDGPPDLAAHRVDIGARLPLRRERGPLRRGRPFDELGQIIGSGHGHSWTDRSTSGRAVWCTPPASASCRTSS
jgi:hypothetical protein